MCGELEKKKLSCCNIFFQDMILFLFWWSIENEYTGIVLVDLMHVTSNHLMLLHYSKKNCVSEIIMEVGMYA